MGKAIALLLVILLTVSSLAGYLFLTKEINAGEKKIAAGKVQLEKGQLELEAGKAELEAGKQELAAGKKEYKDAADSTFLVLADKWFNSGKGFADGREQIAEGDRQVAAGENKISEGEKKFDAGELKLDRGLEKLKLAHAVRLACEIAAVFFAVLSIVLAYRWRHSLSRLFK